MRTALLLANTGTAMIWAMGLHLLIGNALIGILEGLIIAGLFKRRWWVSCLIMIPANYISMFAGTYLLAPFAETLAAHWAADGSILFHLRSLQLAMLAFAFVVTLLIEWPFCLWIVRKLPHAGRKAWKANVVAQIISYALLVWWYGGASRTSIVSKTTLHRDVAFARPPIATVYYINPDDGDVWRIQTDGTGRERALEANIPAGKQALAFVRSADKRSRDLYLRDKAWPAGGTGTVLAAAFAEGRADSGARWSEDGIEFEWDLLPADLRAESSAEWKVLGDGWGGVSFRPETPQGERYSLALELPYFGRSIRSLTVLSSEQAVFELDGTIMLLDIASRDLGVLTKGRGPAVIEPGEMFNTYVEPEATGKTLKTEGESLTTCPAEREPAAGG